jgi:hypothetical protein
VERGFGTVFDAGGGGFGFIFLDGRFVQSSPPRAETALQVTTYGSDGARRSEASIDPRVCECCQTSTAMTAEGPIVAYRDRSDGEIRDIAVARLTGGRWSAPVSVHHDNWKIDGCPVNGPSVAASGRDVTVAWFTAAGGDRRVLAAFSRDAGRTFSSPIRVDDGGGLGRVQAVWLGDGSAAVSWVESGNSGSSVRVRRIARDGTRGPATVIAGSTGSHYPRMVRAEGEMVFAWTESTRGTTRVRTARSNLRP